MSTIKHSTGTLLQFVVVGFCSRQGAQSGSISEQISIAGAQRQAKQKNILQFIHLQFQNHYDT